MSIDDSSNPNGGSTRNTDALKSQVGHDLETATEHAKHDLDAIAQRAKADARALGEEAGAKVSEATESVKSFATDQKDLAANQINGVAAAIGKVADELDGSDQQTIARYARDLASGISSMGKTVQDRDVDDLMGLAQDFGRRQPVAFLGAAALAGFVASRFAMASNQRREQKASQSGSAASASRSSYQSEGSQNYASGAPSSSSMGGE
ncbi:hypothetical protein [Devosia sediminis]|uniref:Nutrient deprivation-induced protein n=1 Tax=Devosia sediminis TaxID=2798801 RepID=A0A934IXA5_9HYPH|nr:hypothetical protein [Devosia sediminis]MBJ3784720.1 hypothetical protein [Devosia sediminis]